MKSNGTPDSLCIRIPNRHPVVLLWLQHDVAARKIVVDIVGEKACLVILRIADRTGRTGDIQASILVHGTGTHPIPGLLFATAPFLRYNGARNTLLINRRFKRDARVSILDCAEGNHDVGDIADKAVLEDFARTVIEKYSWLEVLVNHTRVLMSIPMSSSSGLWPSALPRPST